MLEFDIEFNDRWTWCIGSQAWKLDVQNAGTHEVGHTLILLDLYDDENSEMTMYWAIILGEEGETKKRSLESGDRAGVRYIYPEFKVTITEPDQGEYVSGWVTIRATVTYYTDVGTISCQYRATGPGYDSGWVYMTGGPTYWQGTWNTYGLIDGWYILDVRALAPNPYDLEANDSIDVYVTH